MERYILTCMPFALIRVKLKKSIYLLSMRRRWWWDWSESAMGKKQANFNYVYNVCWSHIRDSIQRALLTEKTFYYHFRWFFVIFSLIQCSSWPVYIHIYLFHIGSIIKSLVSAGFVMCMQETWHNTAEQSFILSAYSLAYTIVAVMYPPSIVKPHHNHSHSFISSYTRHHISWHICLLTWTTQHNNIQRGIAPKNSGKQLKNGGKFVYIHFDFFSILISTFLSASISATPTSRVNFSFHIIISRWQIPIKRRLCTGWALLKRFCAVKPSEGWAGKKRILQCEFCEFLEYSWSSATVMEWNQQNYDHIIIHRMASATAARSHLRERPHR